MTISIREMCEEDIIVLARIYVKTYERLDVGENWTIESAKKLLQFWFDKQLGLAFVALENKKIIGAFVSGIKPWWDGNHLYDGEIFVDLDHQRKGVGTQLSIRMYETALEKFNVVSFEALTFKQKKFPLQWYLSQGFVESVELTVICADVKQVLTQLKKKSPKQTAL